MTYLVSILIAALIGVLIGLGAVWLLAVPVHSFGAGLRNRMRAAWCKWRLPAEQAANPAQATAGEDTPVTHGAPKETLSARLYRLDGAFSPAASAAAHPRDLAENRDFLEAAGLLNAESVALETVLQYALGANWGLSCAALAALKKDSGAKRH